MALVFTTIYGASGRFLHHVKAGEEDSTPVKNNLQVYSSNVNATPLDASCNQYMTTIITGGERWIQN